MISLDVLQKETNLTDKLDEKELSDIAHQVIHGYKTDEDSRMEWKETVDGAMAIAKQIMEVKNHPWPKASNVKFPLITMAAIDYASRTLPEIIPNGNIVKINVTGADPDNKKFDRAQRVATYMSYQLIQESPDWQESVDRLLHVLPVVGTAFKKTYYNTLEKRVVSELCIPDKIVINYGVQSLEVARRVTHILEMYPNDIVTRQRTGLFNDDIDVDTLRPRLISTEKDGLHTTTSPEDIDFPIELLEQHCWLDLDEDGYLEPYVVTVHQESGQILRIVSRFKKINKNSKKEVTSIDPVQYFTDYHFIRSPDGGFYSMGFGALLLPLNEAVNTIINQLVDSGTLCNMQGGFIGKGARLKNGEFKIKMGEWKVLDSASGSNLSQNVVPIPTKEPSSTLYSLLGLLIQIGKDLSSTTDVMKGQQPAQNVATGTINTLVEQGAKVFSAINKRFTRSQNKEYMKIYDNNHEYLTDAHYKEVMDDPEADVKGDFNEDKLDIVTVADPTLSSLNQRMAKASILPQLHTIDPRAADRYILETMQLDKPQMDKLQPPIDPKNPPPPPPDVQETMAKIELIKQQIEQIKAKTDTDQSAAFLNIQKLKQDIEESKSRIGYNTAMAWKMQQDVMHNTQKLQTTNTKMQSEQGLKADAAEHGKVMDGVQANMDATNLSLQDKKINTDAQVSIAKIFADQAAQSKKDSINE